MPGPHLRSILVWRLSPSPGTGSFKCSTGDSTVPPTLSTTIQSIDRIRWLLKIELEKQNKKRSPFKCMSNSLSFHASCSSQCGLYLPSWFCSRYLSHWNSTPFYYWKPHPFFKILSEPSPFLTTPSLWVLSTLSVTALKCLLHCYGTVRNHLLFYYVTTYISKCSNCLCIIFPTRHRAPWKSRPFLKVFVYLWQHLKHGEALKAWMGCFKVFCSSGWS